jgi:hypothetical protein
MKATRSKNLKKLIDFRPQNSLLRPTEEREKKGPTV